MAKEYDIITALHYATYRPSLHSEILSAFLESNKKYEFGLDVGCGTGQSSIALANYCSNVVGVDPSNEMLEKSLQHPIITYQLIDSNTFNFDNDVFDIITFAGSLYYAKSQSTLDEIIRVAKKNCRIIIYDFEIFLEPICIQLGLSSKIKQPNDYNHQANFSELDEQFITFDNELNNEVSLDIKITDLTHLLLSSKENYDRLSEAFGAIDLYDETTMRLQTVLKNNITTLKAMTYLTSYSVIK
ncbi:Methyltransferase domain-containing protein [Maribacter orientalis]|uniref:Methyltransferase domain-containing protein n=1 Tax=Maribacter orientalis TaxID=228957 RepID=A0A1H7UBC5_9FLAO|nr:class I SAM-dependent methyltransferase [Maribacter orientalis]SEL94044.1 Methyltransferase domain-containing protein [Maribacter orientalis]